MLVIVVADYEQLSLRAADIVTGALNRNPRLVLGLCTGSTPLGLLDKAAAARLRHLDYYQEVEEQTRRHTPEKLQ